jgi:hypothetical protein
VRSWIKPLLCGWPLGALAALLLGACSAKPTLRSEVRVSSSDTKTTLRASGVIARALDGKGVTYKGGSAPGAISFEFDGTVKEHGLESLLEGLRSSCDVRVVERKIAEP